MSLTLVFIGEVKINIRLFVSLETKESLERNIKSHLIKLRSAFWAYLIRHIAACASGKCFDFI